MDAQVIPVVFREIDDRQRVSLMNSATQAYLVREGIDLTEGMMVRLCEPMAAPEHKLDWKVADGRVTYVRETGRWMVELDCPVVVASGVGDDHWAAKIEPAFMGPIAG
jgi:hypothetical protein